MILQPKSLQGAPRLEPATLRAGPGVNQSSRSGKCVLEVRRQRRAGSSVVTHPFQPYRSPYTGTGTPPDDQARRLRIRPGYIVSGGQYLMPSNIAEEFLVPADSFTVFWVKVDLLHTGGTTSIAAAVIEQGEEIPEAESGSEPPTVYLHLFWAPTGSDAITSFLPAQKTNAFGGMTVTNMSCAEIWREWRWNLNENVY